MSLIAQIIIFISSALLTTLGNSCCRLKYTIKHAIYVPISHGRNNM
ncbi:MAG: hypothetical protein ACI935_001886 [Moritella dasanensis]